MKKILFLLHNFSIPTFVAIILTLFSSLSAQCQIRVEGIVKDENGSPLFGVNILVKGTNAVLTPNKLD